MDGWMGRDERGEAIFFSLPVHGHIEKESDTLVKKFLTSFYYGQIKRKFSPLNP